MPNNSSGKTRAGSSGSPGVPPKAAVPDELTQRIEREIEETFRRHKATSAGSARKLRELGLSGSPALKGLIQESVIRRIGPERYFLHEATLRARSAMSSAALFRLALALIIVGIVLVAFLSTRTP